MQVGNLDQRSSRSSRQAPAAGLYHLPATDVKPQPRSGAVSAVRGRRWRRTAPRVAFERAQQQERQWDDHSMKERRIQRRLQQDEGHRDEEDEAAGQGQDVRERERALT